MGNGLTSLPANLFIGNTALQVVDFRSATSVPELDHTSAFQDVSETCKIVVPDSLYNTWINATNWSDTSIVSHIIKASDYALL